MSVRRMGQGMCLLGAGFGVLALVGWSAAIPVLTNLAPGNPKMVPNSALGFTLIGVAGALRSECRELSRVSRLLVLVAMIVALIIGVGTLLEYVLPNQGIFDHLLFADSLAPSSGRPSPLTALALALLATSLLVFDLRLPRPAIPSEWLAIAAGLICVLALMGHIFGASPLYSHTPAIGVSLSSSASALLISVGLLLLRPTEGIMQLVIAPGPGGLLVRRLALPAIAIPVVIGLLVTALVAGQEIESVPLAVAVLATSMIVLALVGVISSVRPLNRAHQAVESSRARLRDLVENAPDGIFVADLDGRYTNVNGTGCKILGLTRDDIIGKSMVDFIPEEELEQLNAARELLLQGEVQTAEWHLRHRDGHFVPVEVSAKILEDGRWQGFVRDISVRKQREDALRNTQAKFEGIVATSGDAIISIDDEQHIVLYNRAAETIFGWSEAEALGQTLDLLIPPGIRAKHRQHMQDFSSQPIRARLMGDSDASIVGLRKTGDEFPAEAGISKFEVGAKQFYTVTLRDISDRRLKEEALRLSVALRGAPAMVFNQDRDLRFEWIYNPSKPFETDLAVGKTDFDLFPHEEASRLEGVKRKVLATGTGTREVFRSSVETGARYYDLIIEPLWDSAKCVVGISCAAWDITEQTYAEAQQRLLAKGGEVLMSAGEDMDTTLARLAELGVAELADCFLIEVIEAGEARHFEVACAESATGNWTGDFENARRRLGWPMCPEIAEAIESRRPVLVNDFSGDAIDLSEYDTDYLALLRSIELRSLLAVPLVVGDRIVGAMCLMRLRSSHAYDDADLRFAGELGRSIALAIDNAQLFRAAKRAVAARDQVLGIVAHDLRSPLNGLVIQSQMLRRQGHGTERRNQNSLLEIERAARRMGRLINDILDITRLEAQPLAIERQRVDTARLLGDVFASQQVLASQAGLQLRLDVVGELPSTWGDQGRLLQVFDNLIGNAIKFSEPGGEVVLGARREASEVRFHISDSGPGIPEDQVEHLFDRFWQAQLTDRRGAGLGLAIAKGVVEAHGGRIWVESRAGAGASFYFTVPCAPNMEATLSAGSKSNVSKRASAGILLVEDDAASRLALGELLKGRGYQVFFAERPSEAIDLASKQPSSIQALVTDLRLPEMHGDALAKRLREVIPGLRVLYMSGLPRSPADDSVFIQKPFDLENFARTLDQLLGAGETHQHMDAF